MGTVRPARPPRRKRSGRRSRAVIARELLPQKGDEHLRVRRPLYVVAALLVLLALLLRQPVLIVAGLLIAVLTLVPEIWYRFGLLGLVVRRQPVVSRAVLGDEVELVLTVENRLPLPLPWIELDDEFPEVLAPSTGRNLHPIGSERVAVSHSLGLWAYQRIRRRSWLRCQARGAWRLGPMRVRISDPFGLMVREVRLENPAQLVVYPLVAPIERFGLSAQSPFGDRKSSFRLLEDPLRVAGVRPYAQGDEPRRIHWKATARSAELQTKVYDPSTRHTLAVFVDIRTYQRTVYGYDPLLAELAISAAASIAYWGLDQEYAVGLYSNGALAAPELDSEGGERAGMPGAVPETAERQPGETDADAQSVNRRYLAQLARTMRLRIPPASSPGQLSRLMDGLARLFPFGGLPIEQIIASEQGRLPYGANVVYIGAEATVDVPLLVELRRAKARGHPVTLLLTGEPALGSSGIDTVATSVSLAGFTTHRIGGRDVWNEMTADVLGRRATGGADAYSESRRYPERPDVGGGVSFAHSTRPLVVE
jgi:uncharacterized protein (DUF58 family)